MPTEPNSTSDNKSTFLAGEVKERWDLQAKPLQSTMWRTIRALSAEASQAMFFSFYPSCCHGWAPFDCIDALEGPPPSCRRGGPRGRGYCTEAHSCSNRLCFILPVHRGSFPNSPGVTMKAKEGENIQKAPSNLPSMIVLVIPNLAFIYWVSHPFIWQFLLSTCHVPSIVLSTGDAAVDKTDKNLCP